MELFSTFVWASFVAVIVFTVLKLLERNRKCWARRGVATLELPGFRKKIFQRLTNRETNDHLYTQSTNPFGGYMEAFKAKFFVRDLDLAKNIYVKDFDHFVNRQSFDINDSIWNGILISKCDGEWKDLRAKMTPTFTTGKIRRMYSIMEDSAQKMISYLEDLSEKNTGPVEIEDLVGRYAMDVISSAAFGLESHVFRNKDSVVAKMAKKLQLQITFTFVIKFTLSRLSSRLGKLLNLKFIDKEGGEFFDKVIKDTIKHRETSGEKPNDFLQLMIDVKNGQLQDDKENWEMDTFEKDSQLSHDFGKRNVTITDDLIVANCIGFVFGGFDNIQSVLAFGSYALALNPLVQKTLRTELQNVEKVGQLNYDSLNQLPYLDKFINETLRMYPPSVRIERTCTKDYVLPNKGVVPKGTLVTIPLYQIQHDEKYFPNPEVFDPERFSTKAKESRHPYAFMAFGHGPRSCIANRFAMMETKVAVAKLVLNFDLEPCGETTIPLIFGKKAGLKPDNGIWLKLKRRADN